jgi:hypothetical protein
MRRYDMAQPLFKLGQTVMTPGLAELVARVP